MKLLAALALTTFAATTSVHADTDGCELTAPHWIKGPVHGKADDFAKICYEPAHPSAGLLLAYGSAGPDFSDFDMHVDNQHFLHTMNRFPDAIVGATLTIRAAALSVGSPNDTLTLRFVNPVTGLPETNFLWRRQFGDWDLDDGLQPQQWGYGTTGAGHTFTLDLCDLPMNSGELNPNVVSDLVPYLDLYQHLDIVVQDDTKIDFVELKLTYCCGTSFTAYAIPDCDPSGDPTPFLWAQGCFSGGGTISLGLEQAQPSALAGLVIGLGQGSAAMNSTSTLDVLPLIGGPIMLPLDQEGEFEMLANLPPVIPNGITLNMQAVLVNPATGGLRSSNAVSFALE